MKKIIALLASLVLLSGCANVMPAHPAQTFADTAFKDIASSWSPKVLHNYAGTEFYRVCPEEKAQKLLEFFSKQLGPLKSYGTSTSPPAPANGTLPDAAQAYTVMVDFEKGPGNVTVMVAQKEGKWSLHGFQISSELLKRPAGGPTVIHPPVTDIRQLTAPGGLLARPTPGAPVLPPGTQMVTPTPAAILTPTPTP